MQMQRDRGAGSLELQPVASCARIPGKTEGGKFLTQFSALSLTRWLPQAGDSATPDFILSFTAQMGLAEKAPPRPTHPLPNGA